MGHRQSRSDLCHSWRCHCIPRGHKKVIWCVWNICSDLSLKTQMARKLSRMISDGFAFCLGQGCPCKSGMLMQHKPSELSAPQQSCLGAEDASSILANAFRRKGIGPGPIQTAAWKALEQVMLGLPFDSLIWRSKLPSSGWQGSWMLLDTSSFGHSLLATSILDLALQVE